MGKYDGSGSNVGQSDWIESAARPGGGRGRVGGAWLSSWQPRVVWGGHFFFFLSGALQEQVNEDRAGSSWGFIDYDNTNKI